MELLTTAAEKNIYILVLNNPGIDVIRIRNKTNLPIPTFIDAMNSLTDKNILIKIGAKLFINDAMSRLSTTSQHSGAKSSGPKNQTEFSYLDSITAPQIKPSELYIPDQQKFLQSRHKRR